jgi:tetratricopeptide (TPR) repeat protein
MGLSLSLPLPVSVYDVLERAIGIWIGGSLVAIALSDAGWRRWMRKAGERNVSSLASLGEEEPIHVTYDNWLIYRSNPEGSISDKVEDEQGTHIARMGFQNVSMTDNDTNSAKPIFINGASTLESANSIITGVILTSGADSNIHSQSLLSGNIPSSYNEDTCLNVELHESPRNIDHQEIEITWDMEIGKSFIYVLPVIEEGSESSVCDSELDNDLETDPQELMSSGKHGIHQDVSTNLCQSNLAPEDLQSLSINESSCASQQDVLMTFSDSIIDQEPHAAFGGDGCDYLQDTSASICELNVSLEVQASETTGSDCSPHVKLVNLCDASTELNCTLPSVGSCIAGQKDVDNSNLDDLETQIMSKQESYQHDKPVTLQYFNNCLDSKTLSVTLCDSKMDRECLDASLSKECFGFQETPADVLGDDSKMEIEQPELHSVDEHFDFKTKVSSHLKDFMVPLDMESGDPQSLVDDWCHCQQDVLAERVALASRSELLEMGESLFVLGEMLQSLGRRHEALQALERAAFLQKSAAKQTIMSLASLQRQLGQYHRDQGNDYLSIILVGAAELLESKPNPSCLKVCTKILDAYQRHAQYPELETELKALQENMIQIRQDALPIAQTLREQAQCYAHQRRERAQGIIDIIEGSRNMNTASPNDEEENVKVKTIEKENE